MKRGTKMLRLKRKKTNRNVGGDFRPPTAIISGQDRLETLSIQVTILKEKIKAVQKVVYGVVIPLLIVILTYLLFLK